MTPPSDLQAEIERLLIDHGLIGLGLADAMRELAAFCYRDAERICLSTIAVPNGDGLTSPMWTYRGNALCAEAIARRAKEVL